MQTNGISGFNAYAGNNRIELDTDANSSMSTKVNLERGKTYILNFHYRSRPRTVTTVRNQCILLLCWPTTTTSTVFVGGGVRAALESPGYHSGFFAVGDVANWTKSSNKFTYWGNTGEATLRFEATGPSDSIGTVLDEISLETDIPSDGESGEALTGIQPPHVPGMTGRDTRRSDIVTPIVVNKQAAIALGKALFWDQAVGSDQMACASCHFSAGGDSRIKNQVSPGLTHAAATGTTFENTASGAKSGPNYTLRKADFPFPPSSDDDVTSSGTFSGAFRNFKNGANEDECARAVGSIFHVNGVGTRNVEPRNTPTTIDAAFNFRNFWDGRANNVFNGVSPFGLRDTAAGVFINRGTRLSKQKLNLKNASLASQAVGPVGSDLEMACRGRQFADVGRKLLSRRPLALQTIAADDSVLAGIPATLTYADAVRAAFAPEYWNGNCNGTCGTPGAGVTPSGAYNHMEANFSMFFGIAVQMYEETLISDDSKFDRYKRGLTALTASEQRGEAVFKSSSCDACHKGPTFSNAAKLQLDSNVIENMRMKNGLFRIYDTGYYNIGVVPTVYDLGLGGVDPWNNPLSFTRQYISNVFVDRFGVEECKFELDDGLCNNNSAAERARRLAAVNGSFKVPTLRNVALTGPYMHNGSLSTLEQVVDFYNRGGNFNNAELHPDIKPLGLNAQQKADLVAFMKTLTDDRVAFERAPFDHPSLLIPNGHVGDQNWVEAGNFLSPVLAKDEVLTLPAVGRNGASQELKTFDQSLSRSWVRCAGENQTCTLPSGVTASVYYGANATFISKSRVSGSIACNNSTFGDPLAGIVKACFYSE